MPFAVLIRNGGETIAAPKLKRYFERTLTMKNKVSSFILTLTASAVLVSVPAVAQIGGALGSTLGGRGQAQANRGGLGGGLGLDHTLNGSAQRGGSGLGLGSDSGPNGSLDASGTGDHVGETAKKAKGKVKNTADTSV